MECFKALHEEVGHCDLGSGSIWGLSGKCIKPGEDGHAGESKADRCQRENIRLVSCSLSVFPKVGTDSFTLTLTDQISIFTKSDACASTGSTAILLWVHSPVKLVASSSFVWAKMY